MKKTTRKVLLMACSALLLVCMTVGATVAYLTSTTVVVRNTFSTGKVSITLDETKVDEYGVPVANAAPVIANTYKLIPGHTYTKDPTVHVSADSETSWLFVKVVNGLSAIESTIATQMAANWTAIDEDNGIYAYNSKVNANDNITVFNTFTVAENADVEAYKTASITIQAYAVQADGFTSAADAYTADPCEWE